MEQVLEMKMHISTDTKMRITHQILRALAYLHGRKPEYLIHRDLKPSNILLQLPGYTVKVGDFGVSKMLCTVIPSRSLTRLSGFEEQDMTQCVGTLRYMAPEVYEEDVFLPYTHKIDIWSFAMVCYYLWEGVKPHLPGCVETSTTVNQYRLMLTRGVRPLFKKTPPHIKKVIKASWDTEAEKRPEALDCIRTLDESKASRKISLFFWNKDTHFLNKVFLCLRR